MPNIDDLEGVADEDRPRLNELFGELVRTRDTDALTVRGAIEAVYDRRYSGTDLDEIDAAASDLVRAVRRAKASREAVTIFLEHPRLP